MSKDEKTIGMTAGLVREVRGKTVGFPFFQRKLVNILALGLGDSVAILLAIYIADLIRYLLKGDHMSAGWSGILVALWWAGALTSKLLPGWGLGAAEELRRQATSIVGVFSIAIVYLFLSKSSTVASRIIVMTALVLCLPLVPFVRVQVKKFLLGLGAWGVPAVIYGGDAAVQVVVSALRKEQGLGYTPIGIFDDEAPRGSRVADLPVLGNIRNHTPEAAVAIVAMPNISRHHLVDLLDGPLSKYRTVLIIPDLFEAPSLWVQPRDLQGLLGLEITVNLLDPVARFLKRAVEIIMIIVTAPLWLPLSLLIALMIWLQDRGSPFYLQERVGLNGKTFNALKFRTMKLDAEAALERHFKQQPEARDEWERDFKLKRDPRVTVFGRFLRKCSLDELPQFLNVITGEMALVGPRPLPMYHHYELEENVRRLRSRVRPGITGLWQVSGRSIAGTAGMERWDAYYVRNWSVWLDIVIIVRTFRAVLRGEGAY